MDEEERKRRTKHVEILRQDARDEIKKRIEQRDKYSIQMTIALGAIIAFAFRSSSSGSSGSGQVLIAAPLISIYFTVLILYSYRIHKILARYLREVIEPELASLCGTSVDIEWENYYKKHSVPGIRQSFFLVMLVVICVLSLTYLWTIDRPLLRTIPMLVATIIYGIAILAVGSVAYSVGGRLQKFNKRWKTRGERKQ